MRRLNFIQLSFYRPKELRESRNERSIFISEKKIYIFGTFVKLKRVAAALSIALPKARPKATCNNLNNGRYLGIDFTSISCIHVNYDRQYVNYITYSHGRHTRGYYNAYAESNLT